MEPAVVPPPGDRAVRLEMHVLRARGRVGHLVDGVGLAETLLDIAELAMDVDIDIVAKGHALVVQDRRARLHGQLRIEHRGQKLVLDFEQAAGLLRGRLGFGCHRRDPLTDEAHDIVEHVGVVRIDHVILVGGGRIKSTGHILPGVDGDHAGHGLRLIALDRRDARMGMGRAQHFQVKRVLHRNVERVMRVTGNDRLGEGVAQTPAAGFSGNVVLDIDDAVQRVVDAVIAGAAAQIAFQHAR